MDSLEETAPAFVEMAHRIVWATVATVDEEGRPRSRVLHPLWQWDGTSLVGWIATGPTPTKRAHLAHSPFVSVGYWSPDHDTCTAECARHAGHRRRHPGLAVGRVRRTPRRRSATTPAIIPPWADGPTSDAFAALRLDPWRLRVMPGTMMTAGQGSVLTWRA